ncbi:MAG TPA: 3-isopropylmalate dehydrogenase, partial [Gammaproteobacteria bacterium]|nr:3-isopropylmalate dehydrogenase [Gammaproteobacteria bacterium]
MTKKILVLPGDGIGPEIVEQAVRVLELLRDRSGLDITISQAP